LNSPYPNAAPATTISSIGPFKGGSSGVTKVVDEEADEGLDLDPSSRPSRRGLDGIVVDTLDLMDAELGVVVSLDFPVGGEESDSPF
jgi:hypothetical protein